MKNRCLPLIVNNTPSFCRLIGASEIKGITQFRQSTYLILRGNTRSENSPSLKWNGLPPGNFPSMRRVLTKTVVARPEVKLDRHLTRRLASEKILGGATMGQSLAHVGPANMGNVVITVDEARSPKRNHWAELRDS